MAGTRARTIVLFLAVGLLLGGCSSSPAPAPSASDSRASTSPADAVQTIAAVREAGVGAKATVEGTVTTPPGAFASSLSDDGYAIQDASGGIFVSRSAVADVRVGDEVRVSGTVAANSGSGLLVLIPDGEPRVVSTKGRTVAPEASTTGTVAAKAEGTLVSTSGVIAAAPFQDPPYGVRLSVDDGSGAVNVYINTSTGIDAGQFAEGDRVKVVGMRSVYDGVPEIDVRGPEDLTKE